LGRATGRDDDRQEVRVNDGTSTGTSTAPQSRGSGFSVSPIAADADPPTQFLVTNGRGSFTGPIQLIDFGA
jgi:hypothetical protein